MDHQRPVGSLRRTTRDDEQAPIGQPVDAEWESGHAEDDVAVAVEIDGNDLLHAPVGEPQAVLVPTR